MITDLHRFLETEQPFWERLRRFLDQRQRDPHTPFNLAEAREFHYLYQRAAADLARLSDFAGEQSVRRGLEDLVAQTYAEIHGTERGGVRLRPWRWFSQTFPQTFRRRWLAFAMSTALTILGMLVGGFALQFDPEAKETIVGSAFPHLLGDPSERVKDEEKRGDRASGDEHAIFSAQLMTHNIEVSLAALALGMTYAFGTCILLFYNGLILGVICVDYIAAGQGQFLAGWLLPHGVIEIPAILVGGQGGFVLAGAVIGWGQRKSFRARLREVVPDVATLAGGLALMLVWAGIIESYLSQHHEPAIPYAVKIAFGLAELGALVAFLALAGRAPADKPAALGK